MDCGLTTPERLTFDHQLGEMKRFDLARSTKYPISLVIKEIEKCHIVCITCHRLREDARLEDKQYQETKSHLEAITRVFLILAMLSGSEAAYREYRDISREKEKKKKDRQRYKKNRAKSKNSDVVLLQKSLPSCSLLSAKATDKLLYTLLYDSFQR